MAFSRASKAYCGCVDNEPFEEYVKQAKMKPLDDTSAEVENEMKVDVIG